MHVYMVFLPAEVMVLTHHPLIGHEACGMLCFLTALHVLIVLIPLHSMIALKCLLSFIHAATDKNGRALESPQSHGNSAQSQTPLTASPSTLNKVQSIAQKIAGCPIPAARAMEMKNMGAAKTQKPTRPPVPKKPGQCMLQCACLSQGERSFQWNYSITYSQLYCQLTIASVPFYVTLL